MNNINEVLRRQGEIIDRVGWAVTAVIPTPDDTDHAAPFAYTVGLTAHGHPELVIAGLDPAIAQALLNDLASRVFDKAERFDHAQRIHDLIVDYDAIIIEGSPTERLWPGAAVGRYGAGRVRLQQVVWPDTSGRFPWQDRYAYHPDVQPLLARP
jgi:hypothetical protein